MKKATSLIFAIVFSIIFSTIGFSQSPPYSLRGAYDAPQSTYFEYNVSPGSVIEDGVLISNLDPERTVSINTGITGTADAKLEPNEEGIIKGLPLFWIDLEEKSVEIPPESRKIINYRIEIPEDAPIATYETLFRGNLIDQSDDSTSVGVNLGIARRMTIRVSQGAPTSVIRTNTEAQTTDDKEQKATKGELRKLGNDIYNFFQERFEIILIFIILILFAKIIVDKNREK